MNPEPEPDRTTKPEPKPEPIPEFIQEETETESNQDQIQNQVQNQVQHQVQEQAQGQLVPANTRVINNTNVINNRRNFHNNIQALVFGCDDYSFIFDQSFTDAVNAIIEFSKETRQYYYNGNEITCINNICDKYVLIYDSKVWRIAEKTEQIRWLIDRKLDMMERALGNVSLLNRDGSLNTSSDFFTKGVGSGVNYINGNTNEAINFNC